MTNVTPELLAELKAIADVASKEGQHIYDHPRDSNNWQANHFFIRACTRETILALLAHIDSLAEQLEAESNVSKACRIQLGEMLESRDMFQAEHLKECARLDWALKHNAALPFNGTHLKRLAWFDANGCQSKATTNPRATIDALMKGE